MARVLSDSNAGLAFLTMMYLSWISQQLLPDTAEGTWLDRFAAIWLIQPRKPPFFASGTISVTGTNGTVIPMGQQFVTGSGNLLTYQSTARITVGVGATIVPITAIAGADGTSSGAAGNLPPGTQMAFQPAVLGVNGYGTVLSLTGGADQETDDELRARVLLRIQQPPAGGDAGDYEQWALSVPGVTRC